MHNTVFLSSTFTDLEQHRLAVQNVIRQMEMRDISMETFGARDERPASECVRLIRDRSNVFVGIYAHRYGFIPDDEEISICEMEYRAAGNAGLPRFLYLIEPDHPWPPTNIDHGNARAQLECFKEYIRKRHICPTFTEPDQLSALVAADLGRHFSMKEAEKVGPDIPVKDIGLESLRGKPLEQPGEWNDRRKGVYENNRNLFLAHVIEPSAKEGQEFDVFIYLTRHRPDLYPKGFQDVRVAEFYLGRYWENKVFPAIEHDGFLGIKTSAYGTFLCLCRVTFEDGPDALLHRYIDFEAQRTGGQ